MTASLDGHVKFWKKADVGIVFVKVCAAAVLRRRARTADWCASATQHYRSHLAAINDLRASSDGLLLASAGADSAIKVGGGAGPVAAGRRMCLLPHAL